MAQHLHIVDALLEDSGLVSSAHIRQLQLPATAIQKDLTSSPDLLGYPHARHTLTQIHTYTHE